MSKFWGVTLGGPGFPGSLNPLYATSNICKLAGVQPGEVFFTYEKAAKATISLTLAYIEESKKDALRQLGEHGVLFRVVECTQKNLDDYKNAQACKHVNPERVMASPLFAYVAVRNGGTHIAIPWLAVNHTNGLEKVGDDDWELFQVTHCGTVEGKAVYWGMFVEGLGLFNVMVQVDNTRELTPTEKSIISKKVYSLSGATFSLTNLPSISEAVCSIK